jgi:ankyrin repeat protein
MGHKALVWLLLEKRASVAATDRHGQTALHIAVENGHEAVSLLLLEKGVDVAKGLDSGKLTVLQLAAVSGRNAVPQQLPEKYSEDSLGGLMALHKAASLGQEALVKQLLENGVDIAGKDDDRGGTALHMAASKGPKAVVWLLLENGADIATTNRRERTALHLAAENGHEPVVRVLLENGADTATIDRRGWMALRLAASNKQETVVRLLTPLTPDP